MKPASTCWRNQRKILCVWNLQWEGIGLDASLHRSLGDDKDMQIAESVLAYLDFPGTFCVTVFDMMSKKLRTRISAIEGSQIYKRL